MSPRRVARPAILRAVPLDRHAVLEASAGTGKTFTLEHLVVELILSADVGEGHAAAARRRSATRAGMDSQRWPPWASATRSIGTSSEASSVRNRDGRWSVSSPPAAVTTSSRRARVAAT